MSFNAEWLELREPADRAARNADLAHDVADYLAGRKDVRIVDLGAGTGANVRALSPLIAAKQTWRLIDWDTELLARAPRLDGVDIETDVCDLARGLDALSFDGADLVSASALIDLVSSAWFDEIVRKSVTAGTAIYMALSYSGAVAFDPVDESDTTIIECINRHQRGDKGFGPALGPDCVTYMAAACARAGLRVALAPSDWRLGAKDAALLYELLAGWAATAGKIAPERVAQFDAWLTGRAALIDAGTLRVTVGHGDLFARV
jgi:hypothetical protein